MHLHAYLILCLLSIPLPMCTQVAMVARTMPATTPAGAVPAPRCTGRGREIHVHEVMLTPHPSCSRSLAHSRALAGSLSPVRAFVHGDDDALPPKLPMDLMRTLSTAAAEARKQGGNGGISMVGYSQGAIPALASALMFGASTMEQDTLTRVELLNAAMMFWPTWYPSILSSDWWTNPPPVSCKITSWLIKDDPLSEGLPGAGGFRVPMSPGTSIVLPPKHFDKDIMENHSLDNFR